MSIRVDGAISLVSNLDKFGALLGTFIQGINTKPDDDQGFADADAACKTLEKAESALEAAESNALAQTASIDEMRRTVKLFKETARTTRLALEKVVKARKESIRIEIVQEGKTKFAQHIASLNKRLGKPYMPAVVADFIGAIKGLRTVASVCNAVDTELARVKIESNAIADKIEINIKSLAELTADHAFLFVDMPSIIMKENADLILLAKSRIDEHTKAEAEKAETLRAQIQREEEAKATAKAAEVARQNAEEDARRQREYEQSLIKHDPTTASAQVVSPQSQAAAQDISSLPARTVYRSTVPTIAPDAAESAALINIGGINEKLGFIVNAEFLAQLGFSFRTNDKNIGKFYREADFPRICAAIIGHVQEVAAIPLKAAA